MDLRENTSNENRHPWELSRAACLMQVLDKNTHTKKWIQNNGRIVDIGCGDAYFTTELAKKHNLTNIYGVDINGEDYKNENGVKIVNDIEKIPFNYVNMYIMMDVLEHIEDDVAYLEGVRKQISDGGVLFVTVPAFQCLFSEHDKFLKHYRRYSYRELRDKMEKVGFEIIEAHYFYLSLIFGRLLTMNKKSDAGEWKYNCNNLITKLVKAILNIDFFVCRGLSKLKIRVGGLSLLMIVKGGQHNG